MGVPSQTMLPDGYSVLEASDYLIKKSLWRTNTNVGAPVYKEAVQTPKIVQKQIATQPIPDTLPANASGWKTLSFSEIATLFQIRIDEIAGLNTTVNKQSAFSVKQYIAYPYIYKITNCRMKPIANNPNYAFNVVTPISKQNILNYVIPFNLNNGIWAGTVYRTISGEELSIRGNDIVFNSQLPFIVDSDSGTFTMYDPDSSRNSPHPINSINTPAITCYIYRGEYGNFLGPYSTILPQIVNDISGIKHAPVADTIWQRNADLSNNIYFRGGPVIVGNNVASDQALSFEVNGSALIQRLVTRSMATLSDIRLKENIHVLPTNKDILDLQCYRYNYKTTPDIEEVGVIAQEVEKVVPHIIQTNDGIKSVQYDRFGVMLLPIIKEQQQRIETLESEMSSLKCFFHKLLAHAPL